MVDRELVQTRQTYAEVAARHGDVMRRVTTLQAAAVGKVLPPRGVSPDVLSSQMVGSGAADLVVLKDLLSVAPLSQALAEVPTMLQFYRELSHLLAHNRLWSKVRPHRALARNHTY